MATYALSGGQTMSLPSCEYPRFVYARGIRRIVPCGQCWSCRRKLTRQRQCQANCEQLMPIDPATGEPMKRDPALNHFFTMTYSKETVPWTEPRAHQLGEVELDNGDFRIFKGPFVNNREQLDDGSWTRRIHVWDGVPTYANGEELDPGQLAEEHRRWYLEKLGWTEKQLHQWLSGSYEPALTVRTADAQKLVKRIRFNAYRKYGLRLRFLWATEYGPTPKDEAMKRPHIHLLVFGLPHEALHVVYDAWTYGFVWPDFPTAQQKRASVVVGPASDYIAADLTKGHAFFRVGPRDLARQAPRVRGSLKPPIGSGYYPIWFKDWVLKCLVRADETYADVARTISPEVWRTVVLRQNLGQVHLPKGLHSQTYVSPQSWRDRVKRDLRYEDDPELAKVWDQATQYLDGLAGDVATLVIENREASEIYDEHQRVRRELKRAADERAARKVATKRARLASSGALRSD